MKIALIHALTGVFIVLFVASSWLAFKELNYNFTYKSNVVTTIDNQVNTECLEEI